MLETRVKTIIVESLGVDAETVLPDARIDDDLGADSLDMVMLKQALEEEFGIEISEEEAEGLRTLREIADAIADKVPEPS